jgi:quinol monooxygenase YgiN
MAVQANGWQLVGFYHRNGGERTLSGLVAFLQAVVLYLIKMEGCSMVTEIAIFNAVPGKEDELGQAILRGLTVVRQHPECISAQVTRCIEKPGRYMVTVVWTSLEAHLNDFRGGPLFPQWRSHINGLFEGPAEVFHYQPF